MGRWLGAEGLGALSVLNVTVATAVQIGSAGLPGANIYFIAQDRRRLVPAVVNTLIFALLAGGALTISIVGLARFNPALLGNISPQLVTIAALSIPFQLISLLGINIFVVVGRVGYFNLLDLLGQTFVVINAALTLIFLNAGLHTLVSLNTAAAFAVSFLIGWLIYRYVSSQKGELKWRSDPQLFWRMMRYSFKFQIISIAIMLLYRVDLLILNRVRGAKEVGVYAVATQGALLLLLLPNVISHLLLSRVAATQDKRGEFTCLVTRHIAFIMAVICVATAPASFILPLLYGPQFADAPIQLLLLLPGVYLISLESVLVSYFIGTGLPVKVLLFWVGTLLANIALNLMIIPTFGARGAAVVSSLTYALIFIMVFVYFRAQTGKGFSETFMLRQEELRRILPIKLLVRSS